MPAVRSEVSRSSFLRKGDGHGSPGLPGPDHQYDEVGRRMQTLKSPPDSDEACRYPLRRNEQRADLKGRMSEERRARPLQQSGPFSYQLRSRMASTSTSNPAKSDWTSARAGNGSSTYSR